MNRDPSRWKDDDDAPHELRDLLRDAARETRDAPPMSSEDRAAIAAALVAVPPPAQTPASPVPPRPVLGSPAGLVLSTAAAIGVAVAVWMMVRSSDQGAAAGTTTPSEESRGAHVEATPSVTVTVPAPAIARSPSAKASAAPVPVEIPVAKPDPRRAASSNDTLAIESALIGRARASLDPVATLALLDEHARRFPRGELAPEREYLRVKALRALGRVGEARSHARHFLVKFPASPYTSRMGRIVTELEANGGERP